MKCVISGTNIKILARAIHSLAKIGDEMYMQPQANAISFRCVNLANSAYADFTFHEMFFSYYSYGDLADEDALKCKIAIRSAMMVFKTPNNVEKQVESCHIKLTPNTTNLIFIFKYKNSIIKTHLLPILDCEILKATYDKDEVPNKLAVQPKVLADVVQNFPQSLIEVTMEVTPQKVLVRNYVDENSNSTNLTRTQLVLGTGEFNQYCVGVDATITFCLKELRAILQFAENSNLPIHIHFEVAGRPVVFILKNQLYEANLVLSTLNPDADSQSENSMPAVNARNKSINKRQAKRTSHKPASKRIKKDTSKFGKMNDSNVFSSRRLVEPSTPTCNSRFTDSEDIAFNTSNICETPHDRLMSANERAENAVIPSSSKLSFHDRTYSSNTSKTKSNLSDMDLDGHNEEDDMVQGSPPRQTPKRAHVVFQKCFQTTFDPRMLPGHEEVLAEDSDEENT